MVKLIIPSFMSGLTLALAASSVPVSENNLLRDAGCDICQLVVEPIVALEGDAAQIMEKMENACRLLPVDSQKCENFVSVYGSLVINFAQQGLGSAAICAAVGLCGSA